MRKKDSAFREFLIRIRMVHYDLLCPIHRQDRCEVNVLRLLSEKSLLSQMRWSYHNPLYVEKRKNKLEEERGRGSTIQPKVISFDSTLPVELSEEELGNVVVRYEGDYYCVVKRKGIGMSAHTHTHTHTLSLTTILMDSSQIRLNRMPLPCLRQPRKSSTMTATMKKHSRIHSISKSTATTRMAPHDSVVEYEPSILRCVVF
jgi:hypothetical protein